MPHRPPLEGHSPIYDEIIDELAYLIHEVGLTYEHLFEEKSPELLVAIGHGRAFIIPPNQNHHLMILTNDALGDYLYGERWMEVLNRIKALEE